jgi:crossover junction endodeoxyribonuclease RuvC
VTRILGIDPGSRATGYGVIEIEGNRLRHVADGCITPGGGEHADKLRRIFEQIAAVIRQHLPSEVAIERVFMHRNADSALKLGQARGAAIVACALDGLPLFEYSANQVKQATVGRGHAEKRQIQHMVKVLLNLPRAPQADAADALAAAICHAHFRTDPAAKLRASLRRIPGPLRVRGGRLS